MKVGGSTDQDHLGQIAITLSASWSRARAYHGDQVTVSVASENIQDGKAVTVEVLPEGGGPPIDTVDAGTLDGGRAAVAYTIAWKDKPIPPGTLLFVLRATANNAVSPLSPPLWVDREEPIFSA